MRPGLLPNENLNTNVILGWGLFCIVFAAQALWGEEAAAPAIPKSGPQQIEVRIKDLAEIQGIRENQLLGNGLVVGLNGTGDSSSKIANQELANLVKHFGVNISADDAKSKNIAAVIVTAKMPPFIRKGARIDIQVSSLGDAQSLSGGILVQTPLQGADGLIYAVAQGALSVGGFSAGSGGGGGASVQKNHPVVGRIPGGALVERIIPTVFAENGIVHLRLRDPDFTTAKRMVDAINAKWPNCAKARDFAGIELMIAEHLETTGGPVGFLSALEAITLTPDRYARVIINERTGTLIAGGEVRLSPTAISHGNLFISIKSFLEVSQPAPFSKKGVTVPFANQETASSEEKPSVLPFSPGPTVAELAQALNALKLTPRDIMCIFQALKSAGALHADLIIM